MRIGGQAKRILSWVGLAALLLMGLISLQGMVLCFEPDGRVSLETAVNGVCSESLQVVRNVQTKAAQACLLVHANKKCVDVPIHLEGNACQVGHYQALPSVHWLAVLKPSATFVYNRVVGIPQQEMPKPPPLQPARYQFLRTVILLI